MKDNVSVPLVTPDLRLLRADAVWVTIANWAEGLQEYYGGSTVIAGKQFYSAEEIRARCFNRGPKSHKNPKFGRLRKTYLSKLAETLVKDLRWYREDRKSLEINATQFRNAPFIWQHHDIFQTKGIRLANQLGVPSVLFVDAPYVWESGKWGMSRMGWKWFAEKRGDFFPCKEADLVLAVSEEVKNAVIDLGVREDKVLITPCTVSSDRFDPAKAQQKRIELGLSENFVIGWVGSFRKFHNLDLLIDAFQKVAAMSPQAKLLLIGDGAERERIESRVADYGIQDRVIFTGMIPNNDVPDYIGSLDVAVLPSFSTDGFHYSPLKLREFFAAGVPVIASAVGEVQQVIEASGGGWLVPPGETDSIAEMIQTVQANPASRASASAKAQHYANIEMGVLKQIRMVEDYLGIKS